MGTVIRAEISKDNKYYISKHRYYELKHFCMQYDEWVREIEKLNMYGTRRLGDILGDTSFSDPTGRLAERISYYTSRIEMVKEAARKCDVVIGDYILSGVTKGISYDVVNARDHVPCSKDIYYDLYRRFFWILDKLRN